MGAFYISLIYMSLYFVHSRLWDLLNEHKLINNKIEKKMQLGLVIIIRIKIYGSKIHENNFI